MLFTQYITLLLIYIILYIHIFTKVVNLKSEKKKELMFAKCRRSSVVSTDCNVKPCGTQGELNLERSAETSLSLQLEK